MAGMEKDINKITSYFKSRDEVSALYLFGSAARSRLTKDSDIDIAVLINERQLKRKTFDDIISDYYEASASFSLRSVDIVILNSASPYLKHRILKTGEILFDRSRKLRVAFTTRAIIEYIDFRPIEKIFNKAVANRIRRQTVGR